MSSFMVMDDEDDEDDEDDLVQPLTGILGNDDDED